MRPSSPPLRSGFATPPTGESLAGRIYQAADGRGQGAGSLMVTITDPSFTTSRALVVRTATDTAGSTNWHALASNWHALASVVPRACLEQR